MTYTTISETVDAYNEMLDEIYGPVSLAGIEWDASTVLENMDPCAYKTGWIEYMDSAGIDTDDLEDDYTFDWDR